MALMEKSYLFGSEGRAGDTVTIDDTSTATRADPGTTIVIGPSVQRPMSGAMEGTNTTAAATRWRSEQGVPPYRGG